MARAAVVAATLCLAMGAAAHDSWLSPARGGAAPGELALELGTGTRFPVPEFGTVAASVAQAACSDGAGRTVPLQPRRENPQWLDLGATTGGVTAHLACWAELHPARIELEPPIVQVYFAEIHAPAAQRAAWAALERQRVPWRERYRKFARIELAGAGAVTRERLAAARRPVGLDLEIVVLGDEPISVGQPLAFQVLRDGAPLAGFPVELVSERNKLGVWRETDAQGVLRHRLPFAGRWLLRGTDLRPSNEQPGTWESRFATLALEAH